MSVQYRTFSRARHRTPSTRYKFRRPRLYFSPGRYRHHRHPYDFAFWDAGAAPAPPPPPPPPPKSVRSRELIAQRCYTSPDRFARSLEEAEPTPEEQKWNVDVERICTNARAFPPGVKCTYRRPATIRYN